MTETTVSETPTASRQEEIGKLIDGEDIISVATRNYLALYDIALTGHEREEVIDRVALVRHLRVCKGCFDDEA